MGRIEAICLSDKKGVRKTPRGEGRLAAGHGFESDAHAGDWHRQVSLLELEEIEAFRARGVEAAFGDFGENLVVSGLGLAAMRPGDRLACGDARLEITQLGKECHAPCAIFRRMGDCIMPRRGVFARVLAGGIVKVGDSIQAAGRTRRVGIVTVSDKGSRGEREDASGDAIAEIVAAAGYAVASRTIVPDEAGAIRAELVRLCDAEGVDLALTTGGTGFSPRDVTPEATLAVAERLCPGIPEAMRFFSLGKTKRAMLSRAAAGIRGRTLIVNLPGSPRAVRECLGFVIDELEHGLDILREGAGECATPASQ